VTWQQLVDLWGGGEYQAIAKDARHCVIGRYPPDRGKWMSFAGEPKPLVLPPLARRAVAVDDARAPILPSGVLPQLPDQGLVRDVEVGERVGLPNPSDIRPRIDRRPPPQATVQTEAGAPPALPPIVLNGEGNDLLLGKYRNRQRRVSRGRRPVE